MEYAEIEAKKLLDEAREELEGLRKRLCYDCQWAEGNPLPSREEG